MATVEYQRVTVAELRSTLDALTREKLGLSADQFLDRCRTRELDTTSPSISRLAVLGRLILEAGRGKEAS
jgi:hypothetical protein